MSKIRSFYSFDVLVNALIFRLQDTAFLDGAHSKFSAFHHDSDALIRLNLTMTLFMLTLRTQFK